MQEGWGERVRSLRMEKGLTQAQLAVYAGVDPSAVSLIETGKRNPNTATLIKLCEALEVALVELFQDLPPKASHPAQPETLEEEIIEKRRLRLASWASFVTKLGDRWLREMEVRERQRDVPTEWVAELQATRIDLMRTIEEEGISAELDALVEDIRAGFEIPEVLHREAVRLHDALVVMYSVVDPVSAYKGRDVHPVIPVDALLGTWRHKYAAPLALSK
jgi:transcriptional regulator with XRE-family HTH domain